MVDKEATTVEEVQVGVVWMVVTRMAFALTAAGGVPRSTAYTYVELQRCILTNHVSPSLSLLTQTQTQYLLCRYSVELICERTSRWLGKSSVTQGRQSRAVRSDTLRANEDWDKILPSHSVV